MLQEYRPCRNPEPEFFLFMGVDGQFVGLCGVALKKPRLGLANVHHFQEACVGQQFYKFVRAGRGRGDEAVLQALVEFEHAHEGAEGLGSAESAQDASLVERCTDELVYVDFLLAHRFVVGEVQAWSFAFRGLPDQLPVDTHTA